MEQPSASSFASTQAHASNVPYKSESGPSESSRAASPSVMSSCLSEAAAEGGESASFCDPFSDDDDDMDPLEQHRGASSMRSEAIGAAISIDSSARIALRPLAASRPQTLTIRSASSPTNTQTVSLPQSIGVGTRICGLVSVVGGSSLTMSATSGGAVQRRGRTTNTRAAPTSAINGPQTASSLSVESSDNRQPRARGPTLERGHHARDGGNEGGGCLCCNYTGVRTSRVDGGGELYHYDCICQHSCSSSISSLGSPDLDNLDDSDSICRNSKAGVERDSRAIEISDGPEDFYRQLMSVFENHQQHKQEANETLKCVAEDDYADTLPTIEMQQHFLAFDAAAKHYQPTHSASGANSSRCIQDPTMSIPSVVQLPVPLATRNTLSDLSRAARAICNNCDHNDPPTHISKLTAMSTRQMVQRAAEHRTKIMVALKTPKRSDRLTTSFMPDELVTRATSFLDVQSLLQLRVTCRVMRDLASRDEAGWIDACRRLWKTKANICQEALDMFDSHGVRQMRKKKRRRLIKSPVRFSSSSRSSSVVRRSYGAMGAYRVSSSDAKERDTITIDELCYDGTTPSSAGRNSNTASRKRLFVDDGDDDPKFKPHSGHPFQGPVFSFRFKEAAGADWAAWDPWWNGKEARALVFLRDGTVKQIIPRSAIRRRPDEGGSDASTPNDAEVNEEDDRIREEDRSNGYVLCSPFSDGLDVKESSNRMAEGIHDGRRPNIEIRWRFVTEPMDMPSRPDGAYIRLTVGNRDVPTYVVRRSPTGNWGFCLESCWGMFASFELPQRNFREGDVKSALLQDSALSVTSNVQWREAMLYNYGAVTLPEGRVAAAQYRRLWGDQNE